MKVISSKKFVSNQERYSDVAINEKAYVKNGKNRGVFAQIINDSDDDYLEPDDDLRRAITMDELRRRVKEDIHQWYKEKSVF